MNYSTAFSEYVVFIHHPSDNDIPQSDAIVNGFKDSSLSYKIDEKDSDGVWLIVGIEWDSESTSGDTITAYVESELERTGLDWHIDEILDQTDLFLWDNPQITESSLEDGSL